MEETSEMHSEENKVSIEKSKKRRLKTPAQVEALEKFYNEHKYPTEEMRLEVAEELGLTEKQISGWFCHRRLKDKRLLREEMCVNGRQDRSSGVIQDHGSGPGQDSCGSTKHGDYRHIDPREVESRGLSGYDVPATDMTYEHRSLYTENNSGTDNTSSESSSSLQDRLFSQSQDPYDAEPSRYSRHSGVLPLINPKGPINTGYKPSGYLKVKGEIENAAITAVKKQLGLNYREDGPPLGVEFDPLPPGAFESPVADPVREPRYVANPVVPSSPDIAAGRRQPNLSSRYHLYNSRFSSQDPYIEGADLSTMHDSDFQDKKSRQLIKPRSTFHNFTNTLPGRTSSLHMYEDSTGEASVYNNNTNHRLSSKHGAEGMRSDSASIHAGLYGGKTSIEHMEEPPFHGYDNFNPKTVLSSEYLKNKSSNVMLKHHDSVDTDRRGLSTRMEKEENIDEEYHESVRVRMHPTTESTVAKRMRVDPSHSEYVKQAPSFQMPSRKNRRPAAEMPSSFSEDETADASSSLD
ncbi:Homeobox-DDT domain protein RLT1 [Quillaja saponaria]|uniref:Homeobox-DDT domain protein RLT1 n=1 Tax=Quillaja saponaria TaxID=32244 RepID=A0AAD7LM61_QUISA|nr:Homeobox-DDT domain protein RLT1 [Quillaja saponaria]